MARCKNVCRGPPKGVQVAKFPASVNRVRTATPESKSPKKQGRVRCELCKNWMSRKSLKRHKREKHGKVRLLRCPELSCTYQTKRESELTLHRVRKHRLQIKLSFPDETTTEEDSAPTEVTYQAGDVSFSDEVTNQAGDQLVPSSSASGSVAREAGAWGQGLAASASVALAPVPVAAALVPEVSVPAAPAPVQVPMGPGLASPVPTLAPVEESQASTESVSTPTETDTSLPDVDLIRARRTTVREDPEYHNPELERTLESCLQHPDGRDWLTRVLRRLGGLHVLTTEQLRMEKLRARRRGRESIQTMSRPAPSRVELRGSSVAGPEKLGLATASTVQEFPMLLDLGGQHFSVALHLAAASVRPAAAPEQSPIAPEVVRRPEEVVPAEPQSTPAPDLTSTPVTPAPEEPRAASTSVSAPSPVPVRAPAGVRRKQPAKSSKPEAKRRRPVKKYLTPEFVTISDSESD